MEKTRFIQTLKSPWILLCWWKVLIVPYEQGSYRSLKALIWEFAIQGLEILEYWSGSWNFRVWLCWYKLHEHVHYHIIIPRHTKCRGEYRNAVCQSVRPSVCHKCDFRNVSPKVLYLFLQNFTHTFPLVFFRHLLIFRWRVKVTRSHQTLTTTNVVSGTLVKQIIFISTKFYKYVLTSVFHTYWFLRSRSPEVIKLYFCSGCHKCGFHDVY